MANTVTPWEALDGLPAESVRKLALNLMAVAVDADGAIQQLSDGSYKRSWGKTGYDVGRELLNWCNHKDEVKQKVERKKGQKKKDPNSDLSGRLLGHMRAYYTTLFGKEPNIVYGRDRKFLNELLKDKARTEESLRDYLTFWLECGAVRHPTHEIDEWTQKNIFGNGDVRTFITKLQKIDAEIAKKTPKDTPKEELPWAIRRQMESQEVAV